MKDYRPLSLLGVAFTLALSVSGCSKATDDCVIFGTVTDATSSVAIDSVGIYVTHFDVPIPDGMRRRFVELTDENGSFRFWAGCEVFHVVEVEKEGYVSPPARLLKGGGEIHFVMEPDTLARLNAANPG